MYTCDECQEYLNKQKPELRKPVEQERNIFRLLGRAVKGVVWYFRKREVIEPVNNNPRFLCKKCNKIVPAANVKFLGSFLPENHAEWSPCAASETDLPKPRYSVKCHGEVEYVNVNLAALKVGFCHQRCFEPLTKFTFGDVRVIPPDPDEQKKVDANHERFKKNLQAEIAQANKMREKWEAHLVNNHRFADFDIVEDVETDHAPMPTTTDEMGLFEEIKEGFEALAEQREMNAKTEPEEVLAKSELDAIAAHVDGPSRKEYYNIQAVHDEMVRMLKDGELSELEKVVDEEVNRLVAKSKKPKKVTKKKVAKKSKR